MVQSGFAADIGVIGGSGFYQMDGLLDAEQFHAHTPFGDPSSAITIGTLHGRRVAFISRHDEGHRILPTELPAHANVYAMKRLGVRRLLAVSAVGSLREEMAPLHAVVPDQLIDRTKGRRSSFFGDGAVAHIGFADPFCPTLAPAFAGAAETAGATVHRGGTLVVIEGPAFSTRAESALYRQWGASIIGMTALPEAKLAREAELCYASLCFVTDYDVWRDGGEDVSADMVVKNLTKNVERGKRAVAELVARIDEVPETCGCSDALATALITPPDFVPVETRRRLSAIVDRYWGAAGREARP